MACTDLRGHGDSDATFTAYGDEETAGDVVALIEELGGPAVTVGNSMAAGSSCTRAGSPLTSVSTGTRSWRACAGRVTPGRSPSPPHPDFPDPRAEVHWIASAVRGQVVMVPEAGHYPQSQRQDVTARAVQRLLVNAHHHA